VTSRTFVAVAAALLGLTTVAAGAGSDGNPTGVGQHTPGLVVDSYALADSPLPRAAEPAATGTGNSTLLWGYEADVTGSRILSYNIAPYALGPSCVPPLSQNGRGIAFDPLDGNLWYTFVTPPPTFDGDGFIHKTTPPPACALAGSIPFADGPGGVVQDDIGALDVDEASKQIWVAGYKPITVQGVERSYFYLVNRNTGKIIQSCWTPFRGGGEGNDTLAVFRSTSLPGSSRYLLTDAGEDVTVPNTLAALEQSSCHNGREAEIIAEFPKTDGVTGIDFEWPGLLSTDLFVLTNKGAPPFATPAPIGPTTALFGLEDISLCGFRAKLGGDGDDLCPY
jgi:hypothetical protein